MSTVGLRGIFATAGTTFVIALSAAACTPASDVSVVDAQSENDQSAISDSGITASVKTRLLGDRAFESLDISVTTNDGVVTLEGVTPDASSRETAERIARKVDGVVSVNNRLTTKANPSVTEKTADVMSDSWITSKVKSALLADSLSKGFEINVQTLVGVVLLEGELNSQSDVDHVRTIAEGLDGVKSVDTTSLTVIGKS